jgi:hypothetical protein
MAVVTLRTEECCSVAATAGALLLVLTNTQKAGRKVRAVPTTGFG